MNKAQSKDEFKVGSRVKTSLTGQLGKVVRVVDGVGCYVRFSSPITGKTETHLYPKLDLELVTSRFKANDRVTISPNKTKGVVLASNVAIGAEMFIVVKTDKGDVVIVDENEDEQLELCTEPHKAPRQEILFTIAVGKSTINDFATAELVDICTAWDWPSALSEVQSIIMQSENYDSEFYWVKVKESTIENNAVVDIKAYIKPVRLETTVVLG